MRKAHLCPLVEACLNCRPLTLVPYDEDGTDSRALFDWKTLGVLTRPYLFLLLDITPASLAFMLVNCCHFSQRWSTEHLRHFVKWHHPTSK